MVGVAVFSGSLYLLCLSGLNWLGAIYTHWGHLSDCRMAQLFLADPKDPSLSFLDGSIS